MVSNTQHGWQQLCTAVPFRSFNRCTGYLGRRTTGILFQVVLNLDAYAHKGFEHTLVSPTQRPEVAYSGVLHPPPHPPRCRWCLLSVSRDDFCMTAHRLLMVRCWRSRPR